MRTDHGDGNRTSGNADYRVLVTHDRAWTAEHTGQSLEQITIDFDGDRWFAGPEAVAYGLAEEVIGPESGTPA